MLSSFSLSNAKDTSIRPLVTLAAYPSMLKMRNLVDSLSGAHVLRKDYKTLLKTAPALSIASTELLEMTYSSHNTKKVESYRSHRDELGRLVVEYVSAAGKFDSAAVLELASRLRMQCDSVVVSLLPVSWRSFDHLRVTVFEAFGQPPIADDQSVLATGLARVKKRLNSFVKSSPPLQISKSLADLIPAEKRVFTSLVAKMTLSLGAKDLPKFKLQATELNARMMNFSLSYLQ